jgi:hypothetical protein
MEDERPTQYEAALGVGPGDILDNWAVLDPQRAAFLINEWKASQHLESGGPSGGGVPSDVPPLMDGVASPGTSTLYSRGDHVHPTDTSLAPLASPVFTGSPAAPTAVPGDNSALIATTAFVEAAVSAAGGVVPSNALPLMDGVAAAGVSALYSRGDHVHPSDTSRAPLASPGLTGTPTAPTAGAGVSTTQIATTAFVGGAIGALAPIPLPSTVNPSMDGVAAPGASTLYSRGDHVHPSDTSRAPLASPTFTGTPAAPTATAGTSTTQLATTAFVGSAITAANVPGPSNAAPAMDSAAAPGVAITYSRGDHVHPSDTSKLALAGGTMTGNLILNADPTASAQASTKNYVDSQITALNGVLMKWVPYTGTGQSFLAQQLTRDGDWTMVANKSTTTRPAPQPSGPETDLLPAWTPVLNNNRASYTFYNEWTLNQAGWISQYGCDIFAENSGMTHAITLQVNGVTRDTYTAVPTGNAGVYLHDIPPIVVASGAVVRVTLSVTQTGTNRVYWQEQAALFATAPTYCSLAAGSKDGATAGTTGYGAHATFTPGTASPDWDIVAFGGSAAPSTGAGGGITDAPSDGNQYARQNAAWTAVAVASSTVPAMDGTAAVGTGTTWARADHVHPSDTSRAPLASPALTGAPTAPTAAPATATTQLATTAFVSAATAALPTPPPASTASPLMDGVAAPGVATPYSREDHVHPIDTSRAPLASPTFTGTPAAPTAAPATSTTQLATTAFVTAAVAAGGGASPSNASPLMNGVAAPGTSALYSRGDHVHPTDTSLAPLASPALTGTPTAPTATAGTSSTQVATTAFVAATAVKAYPGLIYGLTLIYTAASSAFQVAAGGATSDDNTTMMSLAAAMNKGGAAWSAGSGGGALDTGTIANGWYHVFLIYRPDTQVTDVLLSASATAPVLPANYTKQRRIGSLYLVGGAWRQWVQEGDDFWWTIPVIDRNNVGLAGAGAFVQNVSCPPGVVTKGRFNGWVQTAGGASYGVVWSSADLNDPSGGSTSTQALTQAASIWIAGEFEVMVSATTSGGLAWIRGNCNGTIGGVYLTTKGYRDRRGAAMSSGGGVPGPTGPGYTATSTTSLSIPPSFPTTISLTTQGGLAYLVGARVRVVSNGHPTTWMDGQVTAYTASGPGVGSMQVSVDTASSAGGSGPYTDWNLSVAGQVGAAGATGATGAQGPQGIQGPSGSSTALRGHIGGLIISASGSTASYTVGAGEACPDNSLTQLMSLPSSTMKTLTAFVAGAGNGSLDTGTIATATWYHVHLITHADGSAVDLLISLSATAPTLPSGYTLRRRIGSIRVTGSGFVWNIVQVGDRFMYPSNVQDYGSGSIGAVQHFFTMVPTGVNVEANLAFIGIGGATAGALVTIGDGPVGANIQYACYFFYANQQMQWNYKVLTDTSAGFYIASSAAVSGYQQYVSGYIDRRGKDL